jgi:hypothetical protein
MSLQLLGGNETMEIIIIVLLGIIMWNVKTGVERIESLLKKQIGESEEDKTIFDE